MPYRYVVHGAGNGTSTSTVRVLEFKYTVVLPVLVTGVLICRYSALVYGVPVQVPYEYMTGPWKLVKYRR
jgi:hypothetical protein